MKKNFCRNNQLKLGFLATFFLFIASFFIIKFALAGTLSCSVTTANTCISPSVTILRMSSSTNAHAELPSQSTTVYADNVVCCSGVTGLGNSCSGTYASVLKLSGLTNAHVEQNNQFNYTNNVCLSVPNGGTATVAYQNNNCDGYDTILGSMSATTNAHIGNATAYNTKICASAQGLGMIIADIVNASYQSVINPNVIMSEASLSFSCQTSTGIFGTASQQIYVNNTGGANNGWTLTFSAQAPTNVWTSADKSFDFNDPTGSGCAYGQMTVNPSVANLVVGQCENCTTNNITKGSSASFNQDIINSITLLTATAAADDIGDWRLTGVAIDQKIPAEQAVANDYKINMVLTITAN